MTTASPRELAPSFHSWGRGEKPVRGEHIPQVHGGLCGRAPHHIDHDRPGPALQMIVAARVR